MKTREELIENARRDIADAERCQALHITPATGTILRRLREVTNALAVFEAAHAPTDDEREVLLDELEAWQRHTGDAALGNLLRRVGSAIRRSEAHTPTDDFPHGHPEIDPIDDEREATDAEVEAMRRVIARGSYSMAPEDLPYQDVADRLAQAGFGFRRSEVPEPSNTERIARSIAESSSWQFGQAMALVQAVEALTPSEAAQSLSPEPQGEPSKGQINAAALELYGVSATYDVKRVAAALRAAWDAR